MNFFVFALVSVVIGFWLGHITSFLQKRSYELERQDYSPKDGNYTLIEFEDMMKGLTDLNRIDPAGYNATLALFQKLSFTPKSILEIGFGRGDFSILLGTIYQNSSVTGIDAHELSVNLAKRNLENHQREHGSLPNVQFQLCPVSEMPQMEDSYDVITTTLMNHHILPDEEFINFLKYVRRVGKKAFIFNDLYRSVPNYLMSYIFLNLLRGEIGTYTCYILDLIYRVLPFELISLPLKFAKELSNRPGNSLIVDGGIKSIEKAFTVSELKEMFRLAGYSNDSLSCEYYFIPGRLTCMVLLSDNHE